MNLYKILINGWYIFFVLSKFNLWKNADLYLEKSAYYLKMYIGVVLLYYFNPVIKRAFKEEHKGMIFSAACFILFTSTFEEFFSRVEKDTSDVKNNILTLVKK